MIYVYRRLGFLVPPIPIFCALFLAILRDSTDFYTGDDFLRDICLLSFFVLLALGLKLNRKLKPGQPTHTFYWLKIEYWSLVFLSFGILFAFV